MGPGVIEDMLDDGHGEYAEGLSARSDVGFGLLGSMGAIFVIQVRTHLLAKAEREREGKVNDTLMEDHVPGDTGLGLGEGEHADSAIMPPGQPVAVPDNRGFQVMEA